MKVLIEFDLPRDQERYQEYLEGLKWREVFEYAYVHIKHAEVPLNKFGALRILKAACEKAGVEFGVSE